MFAVLALVNGVFQSYIVTPLPYLLRQTGYSVERLGSMVAFALLPMTIYFLWSPLLDVWLRRRTWIVLLAGMSGLMLACALPLLARHMQAAIWLLFAGYAVSLMTNSAAGGLLAVTQVGEGKGRAGAWMQGGGLAATALGGAALLWCSKHLSMTMTGGIAGTLVAVPALVALTVPETAPAGEVLGVKCRAMVAEIRETLFSWNAVPGVLLLIAPVGSGAAQSLFVAMAPEYHVSGRGVMLLNGLLGGILTMLGALAAVTLPARWDRRLAYAVAGTSCGCVGVLIAVAPMTPAVYFVGVGAYLLTVGVCYAYFLGVVLQTMGAAAGSASTRFTLLVSLGNLPIVYMVRIEAWGYGHFGPRGVPALDAAGNLLVAVAVGLCLGLPFLREARRGVPDGVIPEPMVRHVALGDEV